MSTAVNLKLTAAGQALSAKIEAGQGTLPLTITRITTASGTSDDPLDLTALVDEEQELTLVGATTEMEMTTIETTVTNEGLAAGYLLSQIGFYALDPDEGEILYRITQFATPSYVPAESERLWTYSPTFKIVTGNASEVVIQVVPNAVEELRQEVVVLEGRVENLEGQTLLPTIKTTNTGDYNVLYGFAKAVDNITVDVNGQRYVTVSNGNKVSFNPGVPLTTPAVIQGEIFDLTLDGDYAVSLTFEHVARVRRLAIGEFTTNFPNTVDISGFTGLEWLYVYNARGHLLLNIDGWQYLREFMVEGLMGDASGISVSNCPAFEKYAVWGSYTKANIFNVPSLRLMIFDDPPSAANIAHVVDNVLPNLPDRTGLQAGEIQVDCSMPAFVPAAEQLKAIVEAAGINWTVTW